MMIFFSREVFKRFSFLLILWAGSAFSEEAKIGEPAKTVEASKSESFDSEDWPAIVKTYEAQIQDGGATLEALHNLALARFQNSEPAQAIAIWLAAHEKSPLDQEVNSGLLGALKILGFDLESLDLSAQGPWLNFIAKNGSFAFFAMLKIAVVVTIVFLAGVLFLFRHDLGFTRNLLLPANHRRWNVLWSGLVLLLLVWSIVGFWYRSLGHWGAVIAKESVAFHAMPDEKSQVVSQLKPGMPLYFTGDTYAAWLNAHNADGFQGWVRALDVRIVRLER